MGKMQPQIPGTPENLQKSSTQIKNMPAGSTISQRATSVAPVHGASINRAIVREILRETFCKEQRKIKDHIIMERAIELDP